MPRLAIGAHRTAAIGAIGAAVDTAIAAAAAISTAALATAGIAAAVCQCLVWHTLELEHFLPPLRKPRVRVRVGRRMDLGRATSQLSAQPATQGAHDICRIR